jgi:hypothetical protein
VQQIAKVDPGGMAWGRGCCDVLLTRHIASLGYARAPACARTLHCIAALNQCMEGAALTRGRVCEASAAAHDFAQDSKGVALQTEPN